MQRQEQIDVKGIVGGIIIIVVGVFLGTYLIFNSVNNSTPGDDCTLLYRLPSNEIMEQKTHFSRLIKEMDLNGIVENLCNPDLFYHLNLEIDSSQALKNQHWKQNFYEKNLISEIQGTSEKTIDSLKKAEKLLKYYSDLDFKERAYFRCLFKTTYGVSFSEFLERLECVKKCFITNFREVIG